jgi:predicted kinase
MPVRLPALVVVCGAPASGKTTLARRLATDLRLPLLEKDAIKESLARELPVPERDASRAIGRASARLLWDLAADNLARGVDLMIESNLDRQFASDDLCRVAALGRILILQCEADADLIERRYRKRASGGERHAAHFDLDALPDLRAGLARGAYDLSALGHECISLRTDDGYTPGYDAIRDGLRRHLGKQRLKPGST